MATKKTTAKTAAARKPALLGSFLKRYLAATKAPPPGPRVKIVVGTHHKALTVYLHNVFRSFSRLTRRSFSHGTGEELDYGADVLFDAHSRIDFERLSGPYVGLHVRRDPRDMLVSAAFYHQKAGEPWLLKPDDALGGMSYQAHVRSLPDFEAVLLFEMAWETGRILQRMADWDYGRPEFVEFRYEDLIGPSAVDTFSQGIASWGLSTGEAALLADLFSLLAVGGAASRKSTHIRNPEPGQWRKHFTDRVSQEFSARFGQSLTALGYDEID